MLQHFKCFFLLLYYNNICPILKHHFQKLIQKHICTVRNVKHKNRWQCWNHPINIFKTCRASQNHVKAMHTGHLQQYFKYFLLNWSHFRTLLSVTHLIICTGKKCPKQNKVQKYILSKNVTAQCGSIIIATDFFCTLFCLGHFLPVQICLTELLRAVFWNGINK